jgi:hypothetical protein
MAAAALVSAFSSAPADNPSVQKFTVETPAPGNRNLEFAWMPPAGKNTADIRTALVLFGGRNWDGASAIRRIDMRSLADRFGLVIVSPGFRDDEYWEPGEWSGRALEAGLEKLRAICGAKESFSLIYYGYSAGGQCANLFYARSPGRVIAWGAHGCGVWADPSKMSARAPAFVSCGAEDGGRFELSLDFARRAGDAGISRLWLMTQGGHELSPEAVDLAAEFFSGILEGGKDCFWGDDQTGDLWLSPDRADPAHRNYLPGVRVRDKWLKLMSGARGGE